jgi:hypothetical protein
VTRSFAKRARCSGAKPSLSAASWYAPSTSPG